MTKEQLSCEKTVLQKNLLHYEDLHGRPVTDRHHRHLRFTSTHSFGPFSNRLFVSQVTREERLVVKPLYDRYRLVKQMLTRVSITPITVSTHTSHLLLFKLCVYTALCYNFTLYIIMSVC